MTAPHGLIEERLIKAEQCTLIWSGPLAGGGREVVKLYRRRPIADPVRRWFVPYRVEREFQLLAHLGRNAVACPEPIWWAQGRSHAHGRHELLATREISGTLPLIELLCARRPARIGDLAPLFLLARRMHECGISHGAFYPTNVLVSLPVTGAPRFFVIDMAHGCRFPESIVGTRPAEFDLLDMLCGIARRQPLDNCARWIAGYGLDTGGVDRLLGKLRDHRLERPWRHFRRAETDTRAYWRRVKGSLCRPPAERQHQHREPREIGDHDQPTLAEPAARRTRFRVESADRDAG
jgi:hypothetical protein